MDEQQAELAFDMWWNGYNSSATELERTDQYAAFRGFLAGWEAANRQTQQCPSAGRLAEQLDMIHQEMRHRRTR